LQQLATSENVGRITLMVDRAEQLDFIDAAVSPGKRATLRLCIDLDASLRLFGGRVHIGARRSATHEPQDAADSHESSNDAPGSSWWA
jgi:D-serine deaminase-like pyridoxal phosphate-dependent protein